MKQPFGFLGQRWFQILAVGLVIFFVAQQILKSTNNPNLVPTVIILGALSVPASFVAYFYHHERQHDGISHSKTPFESMTICFIIGGLIGTLAASFLEYQFIHTASIPNLFLVSLIEETAKLVFPVVLFIFASYRSESDGLLFGVASGMGFAALETMGYAFTALMSSQGSIGALEQTLLIRGLLSPLGHAAWTGIVCAALWYGRQKTGKMLNFYFVIPFFGVIILHALWDIASLSSSVAVTLFSYVFIGAISLTLLILRLRQSRQRGTMAD
jgi:RsiW-degrading membrane proteinase PrsW (M82 family)